MTTLVIVHIREQPFRFADKIAVQQVVSETSELYDRVDEQMHAREHYTVHRRLKIAFWRLTLAAASIQ